jgi:hypothetical protein
MVHHMPKLEASVEQVVLEEVELTENTTTTTTRVRLQQLEHI